jgi:two-component system, NarL family, response regulator NreC
MTSSLLTAPPRPQHPPGDVRHRVVIADDHRVMRDGVKYSLARAAKPGYEVVGEVPNAERMLFAVRRVHPDVLILDVSMPDGCGLDALEQCLRVQPHLAIVVLTMHDQPSFVREALQLGARAAYVLKDADAAELRLALRGASYLAPGLAATLAEAQSTQTEDALSSREREVVRLVALGHTNAEIAEQMSFSERTVKNYRSRAAELLGISTRVEFTVPTRPPSRLAASEFCKRSGALRAYLERRCAPTRVFAGVFR